MEKFVSMAFVGLIVAVLLMECAAAQTVHVVGDIMGWSIPMSGGAGAYVTWAATKNFVVGDVLTAAPSGTLTALLWANVGSRIPLNSSGSCAHSLGDGYRLAFNFVTNEHDVLRVPKASYDGCTSSNPIGNPITTGPANITLDSAGEHYYICTFGWHCQAGQKLAITVSATPGSSPSPTGNPTPPTTSTPTAPSPSSSSPADCTLAPTSGPTAGGPTGSTTRTNNIPTTTGIPDSSSSLVLASVLVPLLAIVMQDLFF
ncbi:Phytocyanin domain-containing protein [Citrus sinensis]|uniref:Phytocyanin domain-containing protein n=1 Tax=Citrus sinensis TaxID=2711 RepID=A0ACB8JC20_CITSI|nr:Phytocyanin domain-containing protein [Citrus sinensis]